MKIVKRTWIYILAGLTALVAACTSSKRAEKTAVNSDGNDLPTPKEDNDIAEKPNTPDTIDTRTANLYRNIENLRRTIKEREMSCVYGSPEVIREHAENTRAMRAEADSLQKVLILELEKKRNTLEEQLNEINETINFRSGAKVYGSPEIINNYNNKTNKLSKERDSIVNAIGKIDTEISNLKNHE